MFEERTNFLYIIFSSPIKLRKYCNLTDYYYCYGVVSYKAFHLLQLFSDLLCVPI
jgi:hypothetical protein